MNFLKKDLKEEAKIARRRQHEAERKLRIFNPRTRLFGVDVQAWEQQIQDKTSRQEHERREEEAYSTRKVQEDRSCLATEKELKKEKQELEKRIQFFRANHQQARDRREFDLNDPQYMKKAVCASNGVSRFDGEDMTYQQRLNRQRIQNRAWLLQQMDEKKRINEMNREYENKIVQNQLAQSRKMQDLVRLEEECRRKLEASVAEMNRLSAEEKLTQKQLQASQETKIDTQEIRNWMTGDFLTENQAVARSALGPGRIIPYMYKGEPVEKEILTKHCQQQQSQEKKERAQKEAADMSSWDEYNKATHREAEAMNRYFMEQQRELDKQMVSFNTKLAENQKCQESIRNEIRHLKPTSEFFDQFNKTTY